MRHSITADNFESISLESYDNPYCISEDEFQRDLRQVSQIRRSLTRYDNGESLNLRVLINQIVCFYNVFDNDIATYLLFHRVKDEHFSLLKAVLVVLNLMTYGSMLDFRNINIDEEISEKLSEVING